MTGILALKAMLLLACAVGVGGIAMGCVFWRRAGRQNRLLTELRARAVRVPGVVLRLEAEATTTPPTPY